MRAKSLIMVLVMVVVLAIPNNVSATSSSYQDYFKLLSQPRYVNSNTHGTYEIRLNKMYQPKADGTEKLVLDMGSGTTATDNKTGMTIADFRSFYITDATDGYLSGKEYVIIAGLVLVPHPLNKNTGIPADIVMAYEPSTGSTRALFVNIRCPIPVSEDQYNMKESALYEYLQQDILFPRVAISKNEPGSVFILSGAVDLSYLNPSSRTELEARGYDSDFFELIKVKDIINTASVESCFSGPLTIFEKEHNPRFKIPELEGKTHVIDRHLIVFKEDTNTKGQINIASVGTDISDFCTALAINIITQPEDEYYWIERSKFFSLMGMPDYTTLTPPSNGTTGLSEKEWLESKNAQSALSSASAPVSTSAPQTNQNEPAQTRAPQTFNMTSQESAEAAPRPTIPSLFPMVAFNEPTGNDYGFSATAIKNDRYKQTTLIDLHIPTWINGEKDPNTGIYSGDYSDRVYYPTEIYINGVYACSTTSIGDAKIWLYPGIYEVTCKSIDYKGFKSNYEDCRFLVKVKEEYQPISLYFWITMELKGVANPWLKNINITSDPVGADVYYGNMYFGTTPTSIPMKTSGTRIELELKSYQSIRMEVLTGNGKKFVDGDTLHFELVPEKH